MKSRIIYPRNTIKDQQRFANRYGRTRIFSIDKISDRKDIYCLIDESNGEVYKRFFSMKELVEYVKKNQLIRLE